MKNLAAILASALILFLGGLFAPKKTIEQPMQPNPLICKQVQLLENKKAILEGCIKSKLAYQSYVLDTISNKQK